MFLNPIDPCSKVVRLFANHSAWTLCSCLTRVHVSQTVTGLPSVQVTALKKSAEGFGPALCGLCYVDIFVAVNRVCQKAMDKFVCPNDRQLALRATLGTGWSSRSQATQSQSQIKLSSTEEEQILQVLRRNEQILDVDRQRIVNLIYRFDRMRQESVTHNPNACALCKQEFGHLSRLPSICLECGRRVCSQCSTVIRAQQHRSPNGCWVSIVPGATSSTNAPRTEKGTVANSPADREQLPLKKGNHFRKNPVMEVSTEIVKNTQRLMETFRARRIIPQPARRVTVCHLCQEAKEVWKRSGAWFYKTLPRYQSHSCPMSPDISREKLVFTSPNELVEPADLQQAENLEKTSWVKLQPRSQSLNTAPIKASSAEHFQRIPQSTDKMASLAHPSQTVKSGNDDAEQNTTSMHSKGNLSRSSTVNLSQTAKQSEGQRTVIGLETVNMNDNQLSDTNPNVWLGIETNASRHPAFINRNTTSTLTASALASSLGLMNQSKKVASLTGDDPPSSQSSARLMGDQRSKNRGFGEEAPFGILYFTLYHDTINKQLHVAIHKAKNLIAMDANGLSDPYVICQILPSSHNSSRPRTSTRPQCLNPVWNEALTFEPVEEKTIHSKTLRLAVLDEDLYGSDWLGEYWLPLNSLPADRLTDFTVPLGPRKPLQKGESDLACPARGKILLGLRYLEEKRQLCVEVLRCSDLAPMDPNGLSDPFVKLYLRPDKTKKTKQKTRVIKATLFPEFNEKFFYEMHASEASHRTLELTVWDYDRGPSNDFIGGLTLGADAKAERRELWLAIFRPPFRRIEAWFQLSNRNQTATYPSTPGICD